MTDAEILVLVVLSGPIAAVAALAVMGLVWLMLSSLRW